MAGYQERRVVTYQDDDGRWVATEARDDGRWAVSCPKDVCRTIDEAAAFLAPQLAEEPIDLDAEMALYTATR